VFRVQTPDWAIFRGFPEMVRKTKKASKKVKKTEMDNFRLFGKPLMWPFHFGAFQKDLFFGPFSGLPRHFKPKYVAVESGGEPRNRGNPERLRRAESGGAGGGSASC
jgi:hypothetical protein